MEILYVARVLTPLPTNTTAESCRLTREDQSTPRTSAVTNLKTHRVGGLLKLQRLCLLQPFHLRLLLQKLLLLHTGGWFRAVQALCTERSSWNHITHMHISYAHTRMHTHSCTRYLLVFMSVHRHAHVCRHRYTSKYRGIYLG